MLVKPNKGENTSQLINRFIHQVREAGIIDELKAHEHFMNKHEKKKYKQKLARQRAFMLKTSSQ